MSLSPSYNEYREARASPCSHGNGNANHAIFAAVVMEAAATAHRQCLAGRHAPE